MKEQMLANKKQLEQIKSKINQTGSRAQSATTNQSKLQDYSKLDPELQRQLMEFENDDDGDEDEDIQPYDAVGGQVRSSIEGPIASGMASGDSKQLSFQISTDSPSI